MDAQCKECIARLYPSNPRQPFFAGDNRYLKPVCFYCANYSPEELPQPRVVEPEWTRRQWQYVQQLRGMVNHLNNEIIELKTKRKPKGKY